MLIDKGYAVNSALGTGAGDRKPRRFHSRPVHYRTQQRRFPFSTVS